MADENIDQIRKKEFRFRGKTISELNEMDIREFAILLKSNEKRTALRQYDEIQKFILRSNIKNDKKKPIRTHSRYIIIVPKMIGMRINVFNGKTYVPVVIEKEMLGHRLGEFSVTRNRVKHGSAGVGATRSSASKAVK